MTIPQELRQIADAIDDAQYCTHASRLRGMARDLESSCDDLLAQADALDGFWQQPSALDRASLIGVAIGAIRSAATRIIGFERAHDRSAA